MLLALGLARLSDDPDWALILIPATVILALVRIATSHVRVSDDVLAVRNPFRSYLLPMSHIQEVQRGSHLLLGPWRLVVPWALRLRTLEAVTVDDRRVIAFAALDVRMFGEWVRLGTLEPADIEAIIRARREGTATTPP